MTTNETEKELEIYTSIAELPAPLRVLLQILTIVPLVLILLFFGEALEAPL